MRGLMILAVLAGLTAPGCSVGNGKPDDGGGGGEGGARPGKADDGGADGPPSGGGSAPLAQTLPGVVFWLEARSGIGTGAGLPVVLWRDQSGHDNHAVQADATVAPILEADAVGGLPAVRFESISWLTMADTASLRLGFEDFALLAVQRCLEKGADNVLIYRKSVPDPPWTGAQLFLNTEGGTYAYLGYPVAVASTSDNCSGRSGLIGLRRAGDTLQIRGNGALLTSASGAGALNLDAPGEDAYLGAHGQTRGVFQFDGYLAALVLVKGPLSDETLGSVERHLMDQYAIVPGESSP
jgi:hypothetical protein